MPNTPKSGTYIAFQLEAVTNADGGREILSVQCDVTADETSDELDAQEIGADSWEFQFVLPANFDGTEPVFKKLSRYGLGVQVVRDACSEALQAARAHN